MIRHSTHWTARNGLLRLVNEPEKGPRRTAFKEARERMIEHDTTKGVIGKVTGKVLSVIEKRVKK